MSLLSQKATRFDSIRLLLLLLLLLLLFYTSLLLVRDFNPFIFVYIICHVKQKCKALPFQAWTGPESSRRLKLPDCKTIGT